MDKHNAVWILRAPFLDKYRLPVLWAFTSVHMMVAQFDAIYAYLYAHPEKRERPADTYAGQPTLTISVADLAELVAELHLLRDRLEQVQETGEGRLDWSTRTAGGVDFYLNFEPVRTCLDMPSELIRSV